MPPEPELLDGGDNGPPPSPLILPEGQNVDPEPRRSSRLRDKDANSAPKPSDGSSRGKDSNGAPRPSKGSKHGSKRTKKRPRHSEKSRTFIFPQCEESDYHSLEIWVCI